MSSDSTGHLAPGALRAAIESAVAAAQTAANRHAFIRTSFEAARETMKGLERMQRAGRTPLPLAGRAISIKGLFDVQDEVTTARSMVSATNAPAAADAPRSRACAVRGRRSSVGPT
jgi:Asp-tRNA(Asn)/Glu-tRNA(Gln) amidotransferase A subunit family amidase